MTPGARESPPMGLILPFFLVAPLGLIAAGVMLALADRDSLTSVTTPKLLAATHAAALGWLTLSIMGALFQLGPVIFGGRLLSTRLIRLQLVLHIAGVSVMVVSFGAWRTETLALGGLATSASFALFLLNAAFAVRWFARGSLTRNYISTALVFVVATAGLGLTYAMALHHGWFPLTAGRVAAHAHLGLAGFLALTLMGVSYQLVPMFQLSPHGEPRFGRVVLPWMAVATVIFAAVMSASPGPAVRLFAAGLLACGAVMWIVDTSGTIQHRAKRTFDIQGRATILSLMFLVLAVILGFVAASGRPVNLAVYHQRLQLGYAILAIGGWAGATLVGNSFKIVPFLVWNGRFRPLAGRQPVPTLAQLLNVRLANLTLWCLTAAVCVGAASAVAGSLAGLHLAGLMFVAAGALHFATQALVAARRPAVPSPSPAPPERILT